jgi:hypothetical protein
MTDTALRTTTRAAAATGSVDDQARALVARLRAAPVCERCGGERVADVRREWRCGACAGAGYALRARVELAAYCGDEAAIGAVGHQIKYACSCRGTDPTHGHGPLRVSGVPFADWLAGLAVWADVGPAPGWVLAAAIHAPQRDALAACDEQWTTISRWKEARAAVDAMARWLSQPNEKHQAEVERRCDGAGPRLRFVTSMRHVFYDVGRDHYTADAILDAAVVLGEAPVRDAIRAALVAWALDPAAPAAPAAAGAPA